MSLSGKSALIIMSALLLQWSAGASRAEVVPVVSGASPVTSLSRVELINIFLGKTAEFPDGSRAEPIDQNVGVAEHQAFYAKFADKSPAQIKAYWSKMIFTGRGRPPKSMQDGSAVKQWVAENPNSIGYLDDSLVDDSLKIVEVR